ncbi:MAG: SDR family NAD(P)-dependent oxidoreductase [Anaerolineales bacterium]
MKVFKGKVAVVTGAASGIGRSLAEKFAQEEMKVVLADIESAALAIAAEEFESQGVEVLSVQTDVSNYADVTNLAQKTLDTFGAVHILCNNAGVIDMADRPIWKTPLDNLEWLVGVNVWGVIYGIHIFTPIMLAQEPADCHIVNTASIAGLLSGGDYGLYNATKHAVVSISETIHSALAQRKANVNISVLCPGFVKTHFVEADRNKPSHLSRRSAADERQKQDRIQSMQEILDQGMDPSQVATEVLKAIRNNNLYVLPHPEFKQGIIDRMENILTHA